MAELIISDVRPRVQYSADGVQTDFPYPFPIFDQADLVVVFGDNEAAGANDITGVGESNGGDVVFTSPPALGTRITIYRDMAFARETDFQEAGDFRAAVINEELDRMAMLLQQAEMLVADSLHKPLYEAGGDLVLPSATARAGKVLTFDDNGLPVIGTPSEEAATLAASSAAAAAASAAAAKSDADYVINSAVPVQQLSGDGATTVFTLDRTVVDATSVAITIDGVKQHTATYSAAGTALTFTAAPPTGTNNVEVTFIGFSGLIANLATIPNDALSGDMVSGGTLDGVSVDGLNGGPLAGLRNRAVNGDLSIWQRGSSFAISGGAAVQTADRWNAIAGSGGGIGTVTKQADSAGANFMRIAVTTGGTGAAQVRCNIEDIRTLAGKTVTVSFTAKVASGTLAVKPRLHQIDNAGGLAGELTQPSNITITTAKTRYSYTGALPAVVAADAGANSFLRFFLEPASASITFTLDLYDLQIEEGAVATPLEARPIALERALCQRYYQLLGHGGAGQWSTSNRASMGLNFPTKMRAAPTLSLKSGTYSVLEAGVGTKTAATPTIDDSAVDIAGAVVEIGGFAGATVGNSALSKSTLLQFDAEF